MKMMMILKDLSFGVSPVNYSDSDLHLLSTAKNNMMRLKCYGGQTCAKIAQSGAGSDAVWETIPISDGPWEI